MKRAVQTAFAALVLVLASGRVALADVAPIDPLEVEEPAHSYAAIIAVVAVAIAAVVGIFWWTRRKK